MNSVDLCHKCGERAIDGFIFHGLFCYDVYVVSPPAPQNAKQKQIDMYMAEKIVKSLEQHGINCYYGSRNIPGGELVLQSLSKPITIIPITILPVYKDRTFTALRNFLLRPDYLDRIVFLLFDSTQIEPPAVAKNCFSLHINDDKLLSKLIQTIEKKCRAIPLYIRKRQFEISYDPESTISSTVSETHQAIPFRRSNVARISFRVKSMPISATSEGDVVCLESTSVLTSSSYHLSQCFNSNENSRHSAANNLAKLIKKDLIRFSKNEELNKYEQQARYLLEKHYSLYFEKLYFWISAAIFIKIYKYGDLNLKGYMKSVTLTKCKMSLKTYDQICKDSYRKCTISLQAKMKIWPRKLDNKEIYIRKLDESLSMIDLKSLDKTTKTPQALIKNITNLPLDIRRIFIAVIAEKLFQKKYTDSTVQFFSPICDTIGTKQWDVFLDVLEGVTEYILKTNSEGALKSCMQLLKKIYSSYVRRMKRKCENFNIVLKHIFSKLVYHPVDEVRCYFTRLLFCEDLGPDITSQLGSRFIKAEEGLVEVCIRQHLLHSHPNLILNDQVVTSSSHTLVFEARTPEGESLLYVFKQATLNDILQTNTTDDAYENFQKMSTIVKTCQGHENIVEWRNEPTNGFLPFFVVEHGKPLLSFLHAHENHLTWMQMIDILIDMCNAVHHCHSKDIILCDITPASFIVVSKDDDSFQTKLASFMYAKSTMQEDSNSDTSEYIDLNFLCYEGDSEENVAAYFSAPETLIYKTYSKYSEAWMLAATFYSVLLYGRRPFQELAHLDVFKFVNEIRTKHTPTIPNPFPSDLWRIIKTSLDFELENRMATETLLNELNTYKNNLETRGYTLYTVRTVCRYINPEDIQRGHLDPNGTFILEENEEPVVTDGIDSSTLGGQLDETVSVRMSLTTKRKILQLNHENILKVANIKNNCYNTTLLSTEFDGHNKILSEIREVIGIHQLFSYLQQMTSAVQYLHNHNIIHCDIRYNHIYVNQQKGTLKLGHFGRAVSLEGRPTFPYAIKMMPWQEEKWSAPEVIANGMYSHASDIYSLALVFEEMINKEKILINGNPLPKIKSCSQDMESNNTILNPWEKCIMKLVSCIQMCQNHNPVKRPTLDKITDIITQIRTYSEQYWLTSGDPLCYDPEYTEAFYDTVIENSFVEFSRDDAWGKLVTELKVTQGIENNTTSLFIEVIERFNYEDVSLPLKNKTRNRSSFIL